MEDPLGGFERIRDLYITYLETAFRIDDDEITKERRDLLESPGSLCTEPIVEPIPRYESSGIRLEDLVRRENSDLLPGYSEEEREDFVELALAGLLDAEQATDNSIPTSRRGSFELYSHQTEMLERGVRTGTPGVVTSGTGSGKTEAFLLPLLAELAREARNWDSPDDGYLGTRWWQTASGESYESWEEIPNRPSSSEPEQSPFQLQREGENRPAAVRGLILYPMNALVEDQLTRIRRALDSSPVRSEMDERFDGNRLFFGRYTSKTGVTGFHDHPRKKASEHYEKKKRKLQELFRLSKSMQETQSEARRLAAQGEVDEEVPFLFPSVDGGELTSRWDMQATPPDVLITNITMLSAMLAREVDAPILDQTRNWLLNNEDAYFYLILDELHLQRGSAGTEVSFLLRLLFERLGLTKPGHRHKLKILSSSASMPMEGERREESLEYLWDMFGQHGTWSEDGTTDVSGPDGWAGSVVTGQRVDVNPGEDHYLSGDVFRRFLVAHLNEEKAVAELDRPGNHESVWREVAGDLLNRNINGDDLSGLVSESVEEAEARVADACRGLDEEEIRPKRTSWLANQLFGHDDSEAQQALRGLLLVRSAGDRLDDWWPDRNFEDPNQSFRLHTFFRSVEGLFASVGDQDRLAEEYRNEDRIVGPLSVERGMRFSGGDGDDLGNRRIELLYCESCGGLYFGGMRGGSSESTEVELLPSEPDLEALPDEAAQQLFETLSYDDYAIFWPTDRNSRTGETRIGSWIPGKYDPKTGQIFREAPPSSDEKALVPGYLYYRRENETDRHSRDTSDPGTAVPYGCPSCGTDYYRRPKKFRLSPLRNFRAGFAKTTQLLATEVYDLLRLDKEGAKLVSFSDSRQDAAKAALDIESRRHGDLYREILVETLRGEAGSGNTEEIRNKVQKVEEELREASDAGDFDRVGHLSEKRDQLQDQLKEVRESSVPLSAIVEDDEEQEQYSGVRATRRSLKPLISRFVDLGVHPSDPSGTRKIKGGEIGDSGEHQWYEWPELFCEVNSENDWQDDDVNQRYLNPARTRVVQNVLRQVTDVVFSKRHFSLEETGLGYPCVSRSGKEGDMDPGVLDAFLRVLGDAYRMRDNPWITSREDLPKPWRTEGDIPPTNRVRRFAEAKWGDSARHHLQNVLDELQDEGHRQGLIFTPQLRFQLVDEEHPYWRCSSCGRIHLHQGAGKCTRCFNGLPHDPEGDAGFLRNRSYLAKRVERHGEPFRLRCEELTGQTDDPSERQRRFKDIILEEEGEISELTEASRLIDLLAVTTTMEVGIDIGPLRSIFQANMPPQRFNYQQRVGRSGRRGKAFSFALTVCRNKSHDLHYFRNPESITGDDPPPPFLTKTHPAGAKRFVRKAWLSEAFRRVRDNCDEEYPGDDIQDIHGEYVPYEDYFDGEQTWRNRLEVQLRETREYRDRIAEILTANSPLEGNTEIHELSVETILGELDNLEDAGTPKKGLAETFAEEGYLPMYGMPTRVRNLYTGHERQESGSDWRTWATIDRDLDIAIQEFSPGSTLVKDKREHQCVGFTGPLPDFIKYQDDLSPFGQAFSDPFWLAQCEVCAAWHRLDEGPEEGQEEITCSSCGSIVDLERSVECRVPNGFRTDFRPKSVGRGRLQTKRYRSTTAEGEAIEFTSLQSNLTHSVQSQTRTYRLNRGGEKQGAEEDGFSAVYGTQSLENYDLKGQYVAVDYVGEDSSSLDGFRPQPEADEGKVENIWLAAPKTTDSLFLAPSSIPKGLRITEVGKGKRRITAARAAALSATYILVNRAALELDIDPEEFDVVEPRLYSPDGDREVPILQITDHLVNGAGFCERLGEPNSEGTPLVEELIRSILYDHDEYPLNAFLRKDNEINHPRECDSGCYHCLHRYSNQMYHGLLDWRLGLSFLRVLYDGGYRCGLDGFEGPGINDWKRRAKAYAEDVLRFHPSGKLRTASDLWAFTPDENSNRWAIIVHPLWDRESMPKAIREAWESLEGTGLSIAFTDTFELSRRQLQERERLRKRWNEL